MPAPSKPKPVRAKRIDDGSGTPPPLALSTNKPVGFSDFSNCTTCVKFTWNAGTKSLTKSSDNWSYTSQNACAGDPARDSLGVYVKYRHTSPLGFFFNNMTISESAVMWVEPTSAAICKP